MILVFRLIKDSDLQRTCNVGKDGRVVMNGVCVCK